MKRKNAAMIGNVLMGLGLVMMVGGVGYSVLSHLPEFAFLPDVMANGSIMGIFIGALLWLAGARIGGREAVADRYWWLRHFDKRCRRHERHS